MSTHKVKWVSPDDVSVVGSKFDGEDQGSDSSNNIDVGQMLKGRFVFSKDNFHESPYKDYSGLTINIKNMQLRSFFGEKTKGKSSIINRDGQHIGGFKFRKIFQNNPCSQLKFLITFDPQRRVFTYKIKIWGDCIEDRPIFLLEDKVGRAIKLIADDQEHSLTFGPDNLPVQPVDYIFFNEGHFGIYSVAGSGTLHPTLAPEKRFQPNPYFYDSMKVDFQSCGLPDSWENLNLLTRNSFNLLIWHPKGWGHKERCICIQPGTKWPVEFNSGWRSLDRSCGPCKNFKP